MKYLLDTNACIRYLNGRAPQLVRRLSSTARQDVAVSAVTTAELFYGSAKSQHPERSRQKQVTFLSQFITLSFDESLADTYGSIRAFLEKRGTPISHPDLQIASTALIHDLTLVTHNTREFSRVAGLRLEDWEAADS